MQSEVFHLVTKCSASITAIPMKQATAAERSCRAATGEPLGAVTRQSTPTTKKTISNARLMRAIMASIREHCDMAGTSRQAGLVRAALRFRDHIHFLERDGDPATAVLFGDA